MESGPSLLAERRNCKSELQLHLPITVDCLSGERLVFSVDQTSDITQEEEGRIMK